MELEKEFNRENWRKLSELIGIYESKIDNSLSLTNKGVYVNRRDDDILNLDVELNKVSIKDIEDGLEVYEVYLKRENSKYPGEFGYLLVKDKAPYILSDYSGDNRGCDVFGDTFIVSGHDGNKMYSICNPKKNRQH